MNFGLRYLWIDVFNAYTNSNVDKQLVMFMKHTKLNNIYIYFYFWVNYYIYKLGYIKVRAIHISQIFFQKIFIPIEILYPNILQFLLTLLVLMQNYHMNKK